MRDMMVLIEPLIPGLRRYARSLLRDADAADDLVQDCLERVVGRWHQRRADGNARSWAYTILHNLAVNRMQQRARRGTHLTMENAPEAALAEPPAQESPLHNRDIVAAMQRLPDDQKAVLLLISVEDLSYAETARVLDIPIGTVMSRLSRARERLRREMADTPATLHLRRVK
ncbi:RNA polymerase sigma factor [Novosphingobium naphthalenivorans]|uniref:RNA polymerase sigma factor n=1 Tax=Novosphingobium naphthalenivorans TaxID=273168 RepID=UPI0008368659|nr:sigma-70 family RNA polymerase sigma factor [Novosphingobium naphthalenivorans]